MDLNLERIEGRRPLLGTPGQSRKPRHLKVRKPPKLEETLKVGVLPILSPLRENAVSASLRFSIASAIAKRPGILPGWKR
jgi:hypothetical protein